MKKTLSTLVAFLFLLSIPFVCTGQQITILHTNDTHSHLFPFGPHDCYGGIARISTLMKDIKSKKMNVVAFHSGDAFVGTFAFNKYLGYPELSIMEGLYDAMCLGNHEFDLGPDALAAILSGIDPITMSPLGPPIAFPKLCANIDLTAYPFLDSMVDPSTTMMIGGIKIGLIGPGRQH